MASRIENQVRTARLARGWTQQDLAALAGVSRAAVSAIESGRLVPSTAAALALAQALDCTVEDLFRLSPAREPGWAWPPPAAEWVRYWVAEVGGQRLRYPVEPPGSAIVPHDGMTGGSTESSGPERCQASSLGPTGGAFHASRSAGRFTVADAERTLVVAGCDPAAGLLPAVVARSSGVRLLPSIRSSAAALGLLSRRAVHVAGVHLGEDVGANLELIRSGLGPGYRIVHLVRWTEGVALSRGTAFTTVTGAVAGGLLWVAREEGSGARRVLDRILSEHGGTWKLAGPTPRDHQAVAEAIQAGWAQAGVCVRASAEEAGLDFLSVRTESYDLCYPEALEGDHRLDALLRALRSPAVRALYAEIPGYDARAMGEVA